MFKKDIDANGNSAKVHSVNTKTTYTEQAEQFLVTHGLTFRATLEDTKTPPWEDDGRYRPHYRVTISGGILANATFRRITFDFFASIRDGETGVPLTPYDVLPCLSGDAATPETFQDFCAEYGYDEDSRKAYALWRRCDAFAKRLRRFFTRDEINALQEIQ